MIGGIIGDLAADTYLRDKATFYRQLFDDKALLSEYGLSVIATSTYLFDHPIQCDGDSIDDFRMHFRNEFSNVHPEIANLSEKAKDWIGDYGFRYEGIFSGMMLARLGTAGWYEDNENGASSRVMIDRSWDKEEGYARILFPHIIRRLRQGYSKDETYSMVNPVIKDVRHNWKWRKGTSTLCLLMRAWDCFYRAFDFGSAIHNAVRDMPENPRLMATIVGLMASTMYGYRFYYKKVKFGGKFNCEYLQLPKRVIVAYKPDFDRLMMQQLWQRQFFAKNEALTNVEIHHFIPINSQYEGTGISSETRRRILRAFGTDWENRYGFYLDNGWIYLYRSHYLLGRFKISSLNNGSYRISNVMQTEELPQSLSIDDCLRCALKSTEYALYDSFRYYRFSYWQPQYEKNPYGQDELSKMKFWEGERMFYETQLENWNRWIEESSNALAQAQTDFRWILKAKRLGHESFAILYYINNLHSKFCPMGDFDWLLEY